MVVTEIDASIQEQIQNSADQPGILGQHHPVWLDIFRACGEDCRGLAAVENGQVLGWLFYTVAGSALGKVVNSVPLTAYGGPAALAESATVPLLKALRQKAEELDADVLSIGTSPFLSSETENLYRQALGVTHELANFVQLQDLAPHPLLQIAKKRRLSLQSDIAHGEAGQLSVIRELTPEQFEQWLGIYRQRYVELGAAPYPDEFFCEVYRRAVPLGMAQFWGVVQGAELLGGVMFLVSKRVVDYFASAFLSSARQLYPTTLLLNQAFTEFSRQGISLFNWQSSPGRGGVYQYKAKWGAREWRHFYMSVLLKADSRILRAPVAEVREAFPLRFVLPYSAWDSVQGGAASRDDHDDSALKAST